jgi:hypothetical protein
MKKKRAMAASRSIGDEICVPEQVEMFGEPEYPNFTFREDQKPNHIVFYAGGTDPSEMLRVTDTGFYVRGRLVEQDEKEAEIVYQAFKEWMVYTALTRNY